MKLTRRDFVRQLGVATGALGLGSIGSAGQILAAGPSAVAAAGAAAGARHHMLMITLRGGYDSIQSIDPKDPSQVGDHIHCGYMGDERIRGSRRLFGPLIGGLERHDEELCLIHGVRSDTTSHPDGLAMLARGAVQGRMGRVVELLGQNLSGDAPLRVLDMDSPDGKLLFGPTTRPAWADVRARAHRAQVERLGGDPRQKRVIEATETRADRLRGFLNAAHDDDAALDSMFHGDLAGHLSLAYRAIRGNWARCINVAARANWFDSHSDNDRFQRERQPSFFADLATLIDLLKSHRTESGTLLDCTTIAVFSEFGRFPRLNGEKGKDHFPENSWILAGRGVRAGQTVGQTDLTGKGTAIDFGTGAPRKDGGRPIFINNTFATLAAIAGGKAGRKAYQGDAVLDCAIG
jgi:uncharacterized protein (DUF1501 family)